MFDVYGPPASATGRVVGGDLRRSPPPNAATAPASVSTSARTGHAPAATSARSVAVATPSSPVDVVTDDAVRA